jgi:hypothetical protein
MSAMSPVRCVAVTILALAVLWVVGWWLELEHTRRMRDRYNVARNAASQEEAKAYRASMELSAFQATLPHGWARPGESPELERV